MRKSPGNDEAAWLLTRLVKQRRQLKQHLLDAPYVENQQFAKVGGYYSERYVFWVPDEYAEEIRNEVEHLQTLAKKIEGDYQQAGHVSRRRIPRACWAPILCDVDTRQINITASPAHSSRRISREDAQQLIDQRHLKTMLPAGDYFRYIQESGGDYRAAITTSQYARYTVKPHEFMIVVYRPEQRPVLYVSSPKAPKQRRSDFRRQHEQPLVDFGHAWLYPEK